MLTKKKKKELISIITELSHVKVQELKESIVNMEFNTEYRIYKWKSSGGSFFRCEELIYRTYGFLFKCKEGNDAPRNGYEGNYLIVKNIKINKEIKEFVEQFLEIY